MSPDQPDAPDLDGVADQLRRALHTEPGADVADVADPSAAGRADEIVVDGRTLSDIRHRSASRRRAKLGVLAGAAVVVLLAGSAAVVARDRGDTTAEILANQPDRRATGASGEGGPGGEPAPGTTVDVATTIALPEDSVPLCPPVTTVPVGEAVGPGPYYTTIPIPIPVPDVACPTVPTTEGPANLPPDSDPPATPPPTRPGVVPPTETFPPGCALPAPTTIPGTCGPEETTVQPPVTPGPTFTEQNPQDCGSSTPSGYPTTTAIGPGVVQCLLDAFENGTPATFYLVLPGVSYPATKIVRQFRIMGMHKVWILDNRQSADVPGHAYVYECTRLWSDMSTPDIYRYDTCTNLGEL